MQNQLPEARRTAFDLSQDEEKGLDLWGFFQRRKAFIILLALIGAGLSYLYFQRQTPLYRSSALLQIIHHSSDPAVESLLAERDLSDAEFVIRSPKLLTPCYNNPENKLKDIPTLRGSSESDAIFSMSDMISVEAKAANILVVSCEGPIPADTMEIANAVSNEYISHVQDSHKNAVSHLKELLQTATDDLTKSVEKLESDYAEFDKNSELGTGGRNPHTERLGGLQEKISELVIRKTELESELTSLKTALEQGSPRDALLLLVSKQSAGKVGATPENVEEAVSSGKSVFQALLPLLMEEAVLAEQVGPDHPRLIGLRKRIEITRSQLEKLSGMTAAENSARIKPKADFLTVYMTSLSQEIGVLTTTMSQLQTLANNVEDSAKSLRSDEMKRANFVRQIDRETALLSDVRMKLRDTDLPNMGGVTASVLTAAGRGVLVYPKLPQFLGMGAFLGALAGLIIGYIVEMADNSFRKPEEIIREFGVPILGHIPYIQESKLRKIPRETTMDRTIICQHLPRSRPSEAYRTVRTAVCFSALGSQHRLIQVTSPAAGDGKSTLACNFAISLAQSGKKTILVESDFRRPRVHKLTGVDNSLGIVDVLRGTTELADAVQDTELEGFYVLPCGSRPRNPSELLAQPEYEQLLTVLREKFEYVIVDTPPVLVVTDPCSVGPRVDGVLLCVRLSRQTRDFGRRALEQLRDVGCNMTGIVINGVDETDAYGYGNYNYSDYRYNYKDYSYGGEQSESYFAESEEQASLS